MSERHVYTTDGSGQRWEAIPHPLYGVRKQCRCGRKFWTMNGYRFHYALDHHILGAHDIWEDA